MSVLKKRELPMGIIFIIALLCILDYFIIGITGLSNIVKMIGNWAIVISAIAMGLGMLNLLVVNARNIMQRKGNYFYSIWTVIVMLLTFFLAAYGGMDYPPYKWIFDNIYQPTGQAFFGLSFLYTCAAAYIAFRVRTLETSMLLIAGIIGMIGRTPIILTLWEGFTPISDWITNVPGGGTFTAFKISIGLGTILIGIRTIIGIERSYIGEEIA
jgi:hypothetical protein